ncbi:MAG: hypothetical protein JWM49_1273 [Microbacteriaceae bacterium]|nr:hypothetical protein [Microbacteriaceae bacterium]
MEMLFVTLGGALLGLLARYAFPRRETHGVLLAPAIGAAVASVVWAALTWAGWKFDGGWIWVVSLVAAGMAAAAFSLLASGSRTRADAAMLARLSRA